MERLELAVAEQHDLLDHLEEAVGRRQQAIDDIQAQLKRLVDRVTRSFDHAAASRDEALELVSSVQLDLEELKGRVRVLERVRGVEWDPT